MSDEHVLDGAEDLLLAIARESADALEKSLGLADGAGATLGGGAGAEEFVGGNGKDGRKAGEVIGAEGAGAAFPAGIGLLRNPEFFGDLGLGEAGVLAQGR